MSSCGSRRMHRGQCRSVRPTVPVGDAHVPDERQDPGDRRQRGPHDRVRVPAAGVVHSRSLGILGSLRAERWPPAAEGTFENEQSVELHRDTGEGKRAYDTVLPDELPALVRTQSSILAVAVVVVGVAAARRKGWVWRSVGERREAWTISRPTDDDAGSGGEGAHRSSPVTRFRGLELSPSTLLELSISSLLFVQFSGGGRTPLVEGWVAGRGLNVDGCDPFGTIARQ